MHWNLIWKIPGFVPFGANLTHFGAKPTIPEVNWYICLECGCMCTGGQGGMTWCNISRDVTWCNMSRDTRNRTRQIHASLNRHNISIVYAALKRGYQIWHPIRVNWPQMRQICDFWRSVSVHLGSILKSPRFISRKANAELKCTETDLKKSQICPIWGKSDPIWMSNLPRMTFPPQVYTENDDVTHTVDWVSERRQSCRHKR